MEALIWKWSETNPAVICVTLHDIHNSIFRSPDPKAPSTGPDDNYHGDGDGTVDSIMIRAVIRVTSYLLGYHGNRGFVAGPLSLRPLGSQLRGHEA